jgi:hypothetical protein
MSGRAPDPGPDTNDEERRRRAAALLAGLDLGDWSSGLVDAVGSDLTPVYADGLRAAGFTAPGQTRNEARANLGLPPLDDEAAGGEVPDILDGMDERADEWAGAQAADLVDGLKSRTLGMLETTVRAALAAGATGAGWTAKELEAAVAEAPAFNRARAKTIADNETTTAEREGLNVALRNTRVTDGKQWFTQEDDLVEEDCEENADAGVIGIEDDFPNGDYPHLNCRCWWEVAELDEDEESQ